MQARGTVIGAECAPQRALNPFRDTGEGRFSVERRENGPANQGRAAQSGQYGPAEPLHGDAAAIDDRGFGAIGGKWRLMAKVDYPDLAAIRAPA